MKNPIFTWRDSGPAAKRAMEATQFREADLARDIFERDAVMPQQVYRGIAPDVILNP